MTCMCGDSQCPRCGEAQGTIEPALYGRDLFGEPIKPPSRGAVSDKFIAPPFSVLNAREGWWQKRKRMWLAYGIKGELGRDANTYNIGDWMMDKTSETRGNSDGVSVFDPVLCELAYRWFCPSGGQAVDPFAGGSVRGIVAAMLGRKYWGCDLRAEQIAANQEQGRAITPNNQPTWVTGDAVGVLPGAPLADFVFSCPPYGDLERYSDDPADLSAMRHDEFTEAYTRIVSLACSRLKPNRFACFVVGDFRDKKGFYRGFVSATERAFRLAGMHLYNEAILVTPCGTAPMRATIQFNGGRKLVKTHQNILVFVKGDPRRAADNCVSGDKE